MRRKRKELISAKVRNAEAKAVAMRVDTRQVKSVSTTAAAARNAKTRAVTVDAKMMNKDIPKKVTAGKKLSVEKIATNIADIGRSSKNAWDVFITGRAY